MAGRRVHFDDNSVRPVGPVQGGQALAGRLVEVGQPLGDVAADADQRPADAASVGIDVADGDLKMCLSLQDP